LDQLKSDLNDQMASSIVMAVALLLVSSFLLFWGSRLVRPTLFITSFLAVGVATLAVMPKIVSHTSATENTSCLLVGITPIATGVLAGCVALCCLTLGMALLGAGAGSAAGYALYIGILYRWPLETIGSTTLMLILSTSLGAFVGACIIVRLQKSVLIFATSAIGACGAVAAMAMLLAHANVRFLGSLRHSVQVDGHDYEFIWPQALAALALFAVGVLVQCRCAAHQRRKTASQTTALRNAQVPLIVP